MASDILNGFTVAILVTDGFEEVELTGPRAALDEAGARTMIVSPKDDTVRSWRFTEWGSDFPVDTPLGGVSADDFDALLLPGGVINPDKLRTIGNAVSFVRTFFDAGKPVASICHGPWTIIEAGGAAGRRMTSWPSLQTDLMNAGADWVDEANVTDSNLTTSRSPDDIPTFNDAMIELFRGTRVGQTQQAETV